MIHDPSHQETPNVPEGMQIHSDGQILYYNAEILRDGGEVMNIDQAWNRIGNLVDESGSEDGKASLIEIRGVVGMNELRLMKLEKVREVAERLADTVDGYDDLVRAVWDAIAACEEVKP